MKVITTKRRRQAMTKMNTWQRLLLGASLTLIGLELVSAFTIEMPVAAIGYATLLAAGALWLTKRRSRGAVVYLGALHLIEVLLAFSFLSQPASETGGPALLVPVIAVSIAGVVGAAGSLVTRDRRQQVG
jgi:hypothetical protein